MYLYGQKQAVITCTGSWVPKINCKPVQGPNSTHLLRKADCNCFVFYSLVTKLQTFQVQTIRIASVTVFNHSWFNSQTSYSFTCKLPYEENSLSFFKAWQDRCLRFCFCFLIFVWFSIVQRVLGVAKKNPLVVSIANERQMFQIVI